MPINTGYIEGTAESGAVVVRIYYDATVDPTQPQPLIDGPRGWCLDITNTTSRTQKCGITLPDGTTTTVNFGQGDPVTTGPANGRSRTAAQLATSGYRFRTDVAGFSIG